MKSKTILLSTGLLLLCSLICLSQGGQKSSEPNSMTGILDAQAQTEQFHHPQGKYVHVNGANLWIETEGHGDPLFLIAGGPGDAHTYMHAFDPLQDSCQLIFIDNFGRGKSDTAKEVKEYSIARDVSDIEGIRKALGFDKINVLGHSYGSLVAQLYAIQYGNHVKHLIIADGFFSGKMWQENDDNTLREMAENFPGSYEKLMKLRKEGFRSSDKVCLDVWDSIPLGLSFAYNPDSLNNFLHSMDQTYPNPKNSKLYFQLAGTDADVKVGGDVAKFDVTKKLKNLKMPVLILAGRFDRLAVPKFSVLYKKYCPQAEFVMFEHSGHFPMIEEPEKTFLTIRGFFKKISFCKKYESVIKLK